jgi:Sortilin, neurotensin receptor 3,
MGIINPPRSRFYRVSVFGLVLLLSGIYRSVTFGASDPPILTPVPSISYQSHNHIHGLGYDSQNKRLFVATHYGIFIWKEGKLFQLGRSRDDFMGFSLHPSNPDVIYTSGHPKSGGNMGVMKSEDGGAIFEQIFRGLGGESVDFNAMIISPANPHILYGWFQQKLYRTKDSGKRWQFASARGLPQEGFCWGAPCLAADGQKEATLYAGTAKGILVSHDFGENWSVLNAQLGGVVGVGNDPSNPKRLFAFSQNLGLAFSEDGGKNWQTRDSGIKLSPKEFVFIFAFDRKNSKNLFAATGEQVFRSTDGGKNWEKIL